MKTTIIVATHKQYNYWRKQYYDEESKMTGIVQVQLNNSDGIYDLSDKVYDVEVENGYVSFEITSYMPPGNYTASAYYDGGVFFKEDEATTKFTVNYVS